MAAQPSAQALGKIAADRGHPPYAHAPEAPAPYLEHGFLILDNNAVERALYPIVLGRKNYLFMGSPAGGKAPSITYTLIETAKLNGLNSQAGLVDVLHRISEHPSNRIDELLPWNSDPDKVLSEAA